MASRANTTRGVTPVTANAWGMGIGAAFLLAIFTATGAPLTLPVAPDYWVALAYLAVIGAARAGYATVLFPIVALTASTLFEGYSWTPLSVFGVVLAGLGDLVMFRRR